MLRGSDLTVKAVNQSAQQSKPLRFSVKSGKMAYWESLSIGGSHGFQHQGLPARNGKGARSVLP
jgi:hypothetical protein